MSSRAKKTIKRRENKKKEDDFKYKLVVEMYKREPELLFEREFGVSLYWYQKMLLRLISFFGYKE